MVIAGEGFILRWESHASGALVRAANSVVAHGRED